MMPPWSYARRRETICWPGRFSDHPPCREDLGCNTVCGAGNVSFGLPNRKGINVTFIPMLIAAGMTSAITNPLEAEIRQATMAAEALMGNDENWKHWIQANAEGASAARRQDRQTSRRRRLVSA